MTKKEKKTRERYQEVGSGHYEKDKAKTLARARKALIQQMDALSGKLESGKVLRDEEIRFLKNFSSALSAIEAKEEDAQREEPNMIEGALKEFVEKTWAFKELTGFTNPRSPKGLDVLKGAGYHLCPTCSEMHKTLDKCPFEKHEKTQPVNGGEEHGNHI